MLKSLFFRWVARSSDSIVAFVISLDAELDKFLAKHDAEVAGFEQEIVDLRNDAQAEAQRILDEAEDAVKSVTDTIDEKVKAAKILAGLKKSLPTGE
jgi:F0F1-type ATP synthase membrane subunit b/b'